MPFDRIRPGVAWQPDRPVTLERRRLRRSTFDRYLFSEELATAVNVALHRGRPLLVTGEPGTGKTALAFGIARQLGAGEVLEFHTRSSSKARDLLYTVDDLARFRDASAQDERARDPRNYVRLGALGQAIASAASRVVLIDEVDKAPREFPNDLLHELDRMEFDVEETAEHHEARASHVLVITSNSERRLPGPFLRRCVYHHVPFPDADTLDRIVSLHTEDLGIADGFRRLAVRRFLGIREAFGLGKPPATDELISWVSVLHALGIDEQSLEFMPVQELPGLQTLVKSREDLERLER